MIRTTATLLLPLALFCLASADPGSAKVLQLDTMKIGDVGKLQPAFKQGDMEFYYEFIASHGSHAMLVRERLNKKYNGIPATMPGLEFGVQGIPTEGLDKGDRVNLNKYVFEFVAEMALNPNKKYIKTKILKVK